MFLDTINNRRNLWNDLVQLGLQSLETLDIYLVFNKEKKIEQWYEINIS